VGKKLLLVFIILLGVALIAALVLSLFPRYIPESILRNNNNQSQGDPSAFQGLNESSSTPTLEPTVPPYKEVGEADVVADKFLKDSLALNERERQGLEPLPWQWDTVKFYAGIASKDTQNKKLGIYFYYPKDPNNIRQVSVNCPVETSAKFYAKDLGFLGSNIDVFEEAKKNDFISAFCLNEACTEIGRECVLVAR
jgi:hypothetical protein